MIQTMQIAAGGQAQVAGNLANILLANNFNPGCLRPYVEDDGVTYLNMGGPEGKEKVIVANTAGTLRKDEWQLLDRAVIETAKPRLQVVNHFRSTGLVYNLANALGTTVLQTERSTDVTGARLSMDGLVSGDNDRPEYDIVNLPIPIISKKIQMSTRQLATSRNSGSPLDTTSISMASRKVAEMAEQLALGVYGSYTFGGGTVYGLTNFPSRITGTFLDPADNSWVPENMLDSVIAMIVAAEAQYQYGPFTLWYSAGLSAYMMRRFNQYDGRNLGSLIGELPKITAVKQSDYLTGKQLVLVQNSPETARIVMGVDITLLQWESEGGLQQNFRVMGIMVPQLRTDANSRTGIVHYQAA